MRSTIARGGDGKAQSAALRGAVPRILDAAPDAQDILDGEYPYGEYIKDLKYGSVGGIERFYRLHDHCQDI